MIIRENIAFVPPKTQTIQFSLTIVGVMPLAWITGRYRFTTKSTYYREVVGEVAIGLNDSKI